MNPYESPLSDCDTTPKTSTEPPPKERWLVLLSLFMVAFLSDASGFLIVFGYLKRIDSLSLLLVTMSCIAVSLIPLAVYLYHTGRRGLRAARGGIVLIGIITGLTLTMAMLWVLIEGHW